MIILSIYPESMASNRSLHIPMILGIMYVCVSILVSVSAREYGSHGDLESGARSGVIFFDRIFTGS
jgi:hypothetical protein